VRASRYVYKYRGERQSHLSERSKTIDKYGLGNEEPKAGKRSGQETLGLNLIFLEEQTVRLVADDVSAGMNVLSGR